MGKGCRAGALPETCRCYEMSEQVAVLISSGRYGGDPLHRVGKSTGTSRGAILKREQLSSMSQCPHGFD